MVNMLSVDLLSMYAVSSVIPRSFIFGIYEFLKTVTTFLVISHLDILLYMHGLAKWNDSKSPWRICKEQRMINVVRLLCFTLCFFVFYHFPVNFDSNEHIHSGVGFDSVEID